MRCIEANKHNHITTTYYLLLKKHLRNGGNSVADLSRYEAGSVDCLNKRLNSTVQYVGSTNQKTDPFAGLNPKTRRLIETASNSKRTGSTGGSASRDNDVNVS